MDSEEHVCPTCGQPVETIVKRHKTLGAWVPVWGPGPCHNPECEESAEHAYAVARGRPAPERPAQESATPESTAHESAAKKS
ncbi:hypothetical protein ABT124_00335 [Streptomyces sp. NPDC001982]|uniref:hypothetical protein n=1 Tax=unclassified Streptomyces TaxID=2593676 RepID=UPI00332042C5